MLRKIIVNDQSFRWRTGRTHTVIKLPDERKVVVQNNEILRGFECSCHWPIRPRAVADFIKRMFFG